MPSPWTATARSLSRAREDLALFRPPPVRNAGRKTRIAAVPALFGLPAVAFLKAATPTRAGGNVREVITYRIRGTGARYRRSIALLLARLAGKGCLSSQRSSKRELRTARVSPIDVSESRECRSRESGSVQVFGRRQGRGRPQARRPASEKRQGTKSRGSGHRRCRRLYGDLAALSG